MSVSNEMIEKVFRDNKNEDVFYDSIPAGAYLTTGQVREIAKGKLKVNVLEPQQYNKVVVLDKNHEMFTDKDSDIGYFLAGNNNHPALSGSGGDYWYVVNDALKHFIAKHYGITHKSSLKRQPTRKLSKKPTPVKLPRNSTKKTAPTTPASKGVTKRTRSGKTY